MKRYFYLFIPLMLLLSGCFFYTGLSGSGRLVSRNYPISGFFGVKASDASQVNITYSPYYSVSVICDDNLASNVNIHSDGYYLYVEMAPGNTYVNLTFTVNITMPDIKSLYSQEASQVQISGFSLSDNLNLVISEASDLNVYLTDASHVTASVDEASYLNIDSVYPVEYLDIRCSGASAADLKDMICSYGQVLVTESSSLKVNMNGSLIGQVSGASILYFRGPHTPGPLLFSGASAIVFY